MLKIFVKHGKPLEDDREALVAQKFIEVYN